MNQYVPLDITRKMHCKNTYYETYSVKNKRNVRLYDDLEYKNFLTIEMNPRIVQYCEKPFFINLDIDGTKKKVVPDIWLLYQNNKEEIQQISYTNSLKRLTAYQNNLMKESIKIQKWCDNNNYEFQLRTENDIVLGLFYINNLRFLYGLIKRHDTPFLGKYLNILKSNLFNGQMKIIDIVTKNIIPDKVIYSTLALGIYNGEFEASIYKSAISYNTEVWIRYDK